MEIDIDRLEWTRAVHPSARDRRRPSVIRTARLGTEPNEEALRAHPPKGLGGLLNYGQKK